QYLWAITAKRPQPWNEHEQESEFGEASPRFQRTRQEWRHQRLEAFNFDQERIVPERAVQFHERNMATLLQQRPHEFTALAGRKQPVGGIGDDKESRAGPSERVAKAAVRFRQIEVIHRLRQVKIAVRVEPLDEPLPLIMQIAF